MSRYGNNCCALQILTGMRNTTILSKHISTYRRKDCLYSYRICLKVTGNGKRGKLISIQQLFFFAFSYLLWQMLSMKKSARKMMRNTCRRCKCERYLLNRRIFSDTVCTETRLAISPPPSSTQSSKDSPRNKSNLQGKIGRVFLVF